VKPVQDNKITVLFSAPLVFKDATETLRPFAKLDFKMDGELLWKCLKEASSDIQLSFDSATHHRLLATILKRFSCLHYSGNGNEHYLPFEDVQGDPNWFEVEDIFKNWQQRDDIQTLPVILDGRRRNFVFEETTGRKETQLSYSQVLRQLLTRLEAKTTPANAAVVNATKMAALSVYGSLLPQDWDSLATSDLLAPHLKALL
jgi:hypothetical protein